MGLPKRLYASQDHSDSFGDEDLLAWRHLDATDNGRIGVYELVEELDKREAVELRRKGTKAWFKTTN